MHISEELKRVKTILRKPEPESQEKFVSLLDPYKEKPPEAKSKEQLKRFDMMVVRKNHLPVFKASQTRRMCFTGEGCNWVTDDASRINELIRRFLKFRNDYLTAVLYDNLLPSAAREDRWIFKYDNGRVSLNNLSLYDVIIKERYLKEIDRLPVL